MIRSNRADEIRELVQNSELVLLLLSGSDCNVCLSIYPDLEEMESRHNRITFINADPEVTKELVGEYLVFVYPTILIFADGKTFYRFERVFSLEDMEHQINRLETMYFD